MATIEFEIIKKSIFEILNIDSELQPLDSLEMVVIRSKLASLNIDIPFEQFYTQMTLKECFKCIQEFLVAGQST